MASSTITLLFITTALLSKVLSMNNAMSSENLPKSPYGTFQGSLFQFHGNLVAFESNPAAPFKCLLIGGLSDGLIPTPYTKEVENICTEGWSLVQPILSSSYLGFGNGDLDRDVAELNFLLTYLQQHHAGTHFAMIGHSTGCQISMHYLKKGLLRDSISIVALQAPVSDREDSMRSDDYESNLQTAQSLCQQEKGNEMMPRSSFWAPITAKRFVDLQSIGGMDDYFSSDYTDIQLKERLCHVGKLTNLKAILVAYSGADEYVPPDIDTQRLTQRFVDAMDSPVAIPLYLPKANHNLSQGEMKIFVDKVAELLQNMNK